jgi:hypothetical protein
MSDGDGTSKRYSSRRGRRRGRSYRRLTIAGCLVDASVLNIYGNHMNIELDAEQ